MLEPRLRTLVLAALLLALPLGRARAQVALDQLQAQPLATDGFGVARTALLEPTAWSTSAALDYANDPLAYKLDRGPGLRQRVVSHQLTLQLGAALGVHPRVMLFASLPVQLVMRGDAALAVPDMAPEGAGLGDFTLGVRTAIVPADRGRFSLAGELVARLPTAELTRPSQLYSGDRVGRYEAALLGELRLGIVDLRLRLGVALRAAEHLQNLALGQSLSFAGGVRVRLPREVSLHVELIGSSYLTHPFRQDHTPLELLAGPKYRFARGWLGAAGSAGLVRGYGSPDFRVVAMAGFTTSKGTR